MTKIISVVNHKGGVGKTTTSLNVGAGLALKGYKVLLIDLDAQANLSQSVGINETSNKTIYDSLVNENPLPIKEISTNLHIVPSHLDLSVAEIELQGEVMRELILKDRIEQIRENYEYIIIDCPPSLGLLTINALSASTDIIIPVQSEFLALQGISKLIYVYEKIQKKINRELKLTGILLTRFDKRKNLSKESEITVVKYFKEYVFETKIRDNISIAEAPSNLQHIFDFSPKSNGAEDYSNLVTELINRCK